MSRIFLVRVDRDPVVQRIVRRPVEIWWSGDVTVIPKDAILCDACNEQVAVDEKGVGEGLPAGYAVVEAGDGEMWMTEIVCERCRERYFKRCEVYDEIPDGLSGEVEK